MQHKLARAIETAAKGFSQAVLKVKPGQRDLRFFYSVAAPKVADRTYEFTILAPLASFIIQPGGSIGITTLLPRGATEIEAIALQNPQNPDSMIPATTADLAGRRCIAWSWQNDPQIRVRYQY